MEHHEIREQLVEAARRISRRNMQTGNGGNFSARCGENRMLIKPGNSSFETVRPEELVYAGFDGEGLESGKKPSKEAVLHGLIYDCFPKVNVIMHCHAPWSTAWAQNMQPLDYATYHSALKFGPVVPVFDTHSYAVPREEAEKVIRELEQMTEVKVFLLRRHGVFAMGKEIGEAVNLAELAEETAMIAILGRIAAQGY